MLTLIKLAIAKRRYEKAAAAYEAYNVWNARAANQWTVVVAGALLRKMDRAANEYAALIRK
jgi:hypothetical protein